VNIVTGLIAPLFLLECKWSCNADEHLDADFPSSGEGKVAYWATNAHCC
jgi:hypothetical protein